jgi:alpha-amylase
MFKPFLFAAAVGLLVGCNNSNSNTMSGENNDMDTSFKPLSWVNNTNVYEVNVRQYTPEGTFNAFEKHLPRLKKMGVKTLWFMPVTPIAQKNKKGTLGSYYAAADYTSINPEFGTLEDFKQLVKSAHAQGFKVIIDWVANHTGWDHVWTKTHPDYFLKDSATGDFKIASGMDDIIELDYSNPQMVNAMIAAMKFWVKECDIDGFRCDLAFWVELDFWKKARREVDAVKPLFWLAENDVWEHPEYMQVFDASYTWHWMHRTEDFYKKNLPLDSLVSVLKFYSSAPGIKTWFTANHDENSWNGTEYEKYGDMAKALAVFSCTWPGIPLIYSGQELPNKKRLEFFERDPIEWKGKNELNDFYTSLLELHSTHPALRAGDALATARRITTSDDEHIFCFLRKNNDEEVLVVLNLSSKNINDAKINDDQLSGKYKNIFTKEERDFNDKVFSLMPWGYLVLEK